MPQPGHGEVLIKVEASGVNPHDTKRRSGWLGSTMYATRVVPHSDAAGPVAGVGPGVHSMSEGDRVFVYRAGSARPGEGTAAQYVVVPQANAIRLPDALSFAEGACLGVPAFTAFHATLSDGPVSGQTVLVQGGAGAVGLVAVELARWSGDRRSSPLWCRRSKQRPRARAAGPEPWPTVGRRNRMVSWSSRATMVALDHRGVAEKARQRLRQAREALGPLVAAFAVEPQRSAILDDLEAVAVELRLMQPVIASRDGLGGRGDAGTDELRGHAQDVGIAAVLVSRPVRVFEQRG
jgi:Zn-dependent alcohol dehydrogenase